MLESVAAILEKKKVTLSPSRSQHNSCKQNEGNEADPHF